MMNIVAGLLISGGYSSNEDGLMGTLRTAEIFDPKRNHFFQYPDFPYAEGIQGHTQV